MPTQDTDSRRAAERAARESFGRLVSYLAWQWRDLASAQDALSEALLKALEVWPVQGIPASPQAWLLTVARRELLQSARHERMRLDPAVVALLEQEQIAVEAETIPDARLKLLFVCAHPAIDRNIRIALMLQTVLGLQVQDIAPALLVSPTALAQRLVRAKHKIRAAGIRFESPEAADLPERLHCVLESIYGAFGLGMDCVDGAEARIADLRDEALYLCSVVCELLPDAAEARGLLALMTFCVARRPAQTGANGQFIPLAQQDPARWDREAIAQADKWLWQAAQQRDVGPFQLEAAVQSAHCQRVFTGTTPWKGIATLYQQINARHPTHGSLVAGAVALAESGNAGAALAQLDAMNEAAVRSFQPWWVARAYLLSRMGPAYRDVADAAFATALGLTQQQRLRDHIAGLRAALPPAVPSALNQ
jgi:RNA polymerase sigma-70 factor (ECF subfamily)